MINPKRMAVGVVVAAMGLVPSAIVSADGHSPCDEEGAVLIQRWNAEGIPGAKGRPTRATLECLSDGRIKQTIEVSKDGGSTWATLFESTYSPVAEEALQAATTAEPTVSAVSATSADQQTEAEETAVAATGSAEAASEEAREVAQHQAARQATVEGSEVQAVSRELEREEIPAADAPELVMASPMVLEIAPGRVDAYPENGAWVTDETGGFICNQVILKEVSVARKMKGDSVELIIGAKLYSDKRQRSLNLLIEALLDDQVLASEQLNDVRVGLNIPGMDKKGLVVDARLEITKTDFDRLFTEGGQRKLRLTVTSPAA